MQRSLILPFGRPSTILPGAPCTAVVFHQKTRLFADGSGKISLRDVVTSGSSKAQVQPLGASRAEEPSQSEVRMLDGKKEAVDVRTSTASCTGTEYPYRYASL